MDVFRNSQEPFGRQRRTTMRSYGMRLRDNIRCKNFWQELSGSLGDLGTFIPILLALAYVNKVDLGTTLLFTGMYNVVTGVLFGVPMPVQPMKSIAAVAIAEGPDRLTVPQIMAAGLSTGAVLAFLGLSGLMTVVDKIVPLPVVRGIQLSQGIAFGITAVKYILYNQDFTANKSSGDRMWIGLDGLLLALAACVVIILCTGPGGGRQCRSPRQEEVGETTRSRNSETHEDVESSNEAPGESARKWVAPAGILLFLLGVVLAIIRDPATLGDLKLGPSPLKLVKISMNDWKVGFVRAAIPQLPLSVLNSVVAVCKLSNDLFPNKTVTVFSVSTSVGLMNLVGCWFGAMPVCHGAGGLAGQYKFGARNGLAPALLGGAKLVLSLLLGSSLLRLLASFPVGLLGALLLFSGAELAMACRDQNSNEDAFVMLVCTIVSLSKASAAIGFATGMLVFLLLKLRDLPTEYPRYISGARNLVKKSVQPDEHRVGYHAQLLASS
ncbi:hypothetical protein AXG93_1390s1170 [Marchantia polymorpha subsp. ruderalis]|uniref:SLC26A/SulP transporter domain-containing protein n=1 Tax=Marchantia polymorpha subsp. ruderalis TaxID=1480154 RepID=A0A176W806_MARPO|nr:hypothetical protein AXG93_1390s1170 [Marchantia polymorpha subsp. ruderalis]